jgi:spermidine/putrescine transport system permease protein
VKTIRKYLFFHSAAVLAFLYAPIAMIVLYSFNESRINAVWKGWTWKWYATLLENDRLTEALSNSLIIAVTSTAISTLLGTLASLALYRQSFRWKGAIQSTLYLPILIPDIVMGLSLLVLFSRFYIPLGKITILIAHITFSISYVYLVVSARLEGMNKYLEEAARDLGASGWQAFRYVTLPLIAPGMAAGAIIAFTLSIDDFMISFFVSGPESTTLPLYIYGLVKRGISPEVNALCTILVVITMVLVVLAERFRNAGVKKGRETNERV